MASLNAENPTDPAKTKADTEPSFDRFEHYDNNTPVLSQKDSKKRDLFVDKLLPVLAEISAEMEGNKHGTDSTEKLLIFLRVFFHKDFDLDVFVKIFIEIQNYPELVSLFIFLRTLDNLGRLCLYFYVGAIFKQKLYYKNIVIGLLTKVFEHSYRIDRGIGFDEKLRLLGILTCKIVIYIAVQTVEHLVSENCDEDLWRFIQNIVDSASILVQYEVKPYINVYLYNHFIPEYGEYIVGALLQYCRKKRLNLGSEVIVDLLNDIFAHIM